jgi:glycerophosphoryl diester phosphodiesterase
LNTPRTKYPLASIFDIQGHRGFRGRYPENTIPGFIAAVRAGATTLEMDIVITGDSQILVSHEPFMHHEYCSFKNGKPVSAEEARGQNIFRMNIDEIRSYDCGSRGHPRFPEQIRMHVHKPLLSEVFEAVEMFVAENRLIPVRYNIEVKSSESEEGVYYPPPDLYCDRIVETINSSGLWNRINVQSFDHRILKSLRSKKPDCRLAILVEDLKSCEDHWTMLGFIPEIYSPHYRLLSSGQIHLLRERGIKVIPWTVNEESDMKLLIESGVDGIITDYPDRLSALINPQQQ